MELIIAEKLSVAQNIAAALGAKERKEGYCQGANAIVTWCVGHTVLLCFTLFKTSSVSKSIFNAH